MFYRENIGYSYFSQSTFPFLYDFLFLLELKLSLSFLFTDFPIQN